MFLEASEAALPSPSALSHTPRASAEFAGAAGRGAGGFEVLGVRKPISSAHIYWAPVIKAQCWALGLVGK